MCQARHYAHSGTAATGDLDCRVCPVGFDCAVAGLTLESLPTRRGYFRASNRSTDVQRCPDAAVNCEGKFVCSASTSGCRGSSTPVDHGRSAPDAEATCFQAGVVGQRSTSTGFDEGCASGLRHIFCQKCLPREDGKLSYPEFAQMATDIISSNLQYERALVDFKLVVYQLQREERRAARHEQVDAAREAYGGAVRDDGRRAALEQSDTRGGGHGGGDAAVGLARRASGSSPSAIADRSYTVEPSTGRLPASHTKSTCEHQSASSSEHHSTGLKSTSPSGLGTVEQSSGSSSCSSIAFSSSSDFPGWSPLKSPT